MIPSLNVTEGSQDYGHRLPVQLLVLENAFKHDSPDCHSYYDGLSVFLQPTFVHSKQYSTALNTISMTTHLIESNFSMLALPRLQAYHRPN
jgi:hypothetical protein